MKFFIFLFITLLTSNLIQAQEEGLSDFYNLYRSGQYAKAIQSIENLDFTSKNIGLKNYLLGLSFSKNQEYDKAKFMFKKAIDEKFEANDLYYEYGQTLYANNNLKDARTAFKKSIEINFNKDASYYYIGHISQILEEYPEALKAYAESIKDSSHQNKIFQVADFQYAETILSLLKQKTNLTTEVLEKEVEKKVLPIMREAYNYDKSALVASDIEKRINEILKEFNLDPNTLKNGRKISSKRFNGYIDIKNKFDDNVTNTNLENDIQQSHKESYFQEYEADAKYDFVVKKKFIFSPELRLDFDQYTNQEDSQVYQNDSMIYNGSLKSKYEHKFRDNPASFIFDLDYSKTYKDYAQIHKRQFYANSYTYTLGDQFAFFNFGDTTLKFKYKEFSTYLDSINNHTTTFSADQTMTINGSQILIFLLEADLVNNYNDPTTSTNSFLLRIDYLIPEIFPKYTLTTSLSTTLLDTKAQSSTRGTELTLTPSFEIARDINDQFKVVFNYEYTHNKSKLDSYTYNKSVTNLEFKYSF